MRRATALPSYLHILRFIHILAPTVAAALIILSISTSGTIAEAAAIATTRTTTTTRTTSTGTPTAYLPVDVRNTAKSIATPESAILSTTSSRLSSSLSPAAGNISTYPATYTATTSSDEVQSSSNIMSKSVTAAFTSTGSSNIRSGTRHSMAVPNSSTTLSYSTAPHSTHKALRSTSKFPADFSFPKMHWSKAVTTSDGIEGRTAADPAVAGVGSGLTSNAGAPAGVASSTFNMDSADRTKVNITRTFRSKHHHDRHWGPFFEEPLNTTASGESLVSTAAHLFTEAVLNCRVGMLKDKTVMWVRKSSEKVSLLTVGNVTYSGDPRIRVKFQYPNNWRLLINPVQREDAGVYMCQVSTHPPRVFTTNLTVLEPPIRLIDEQERDVGDRYYKSGSTIELQCLISKSFALKEKQSIWKSIQQSAPVQNQTKPNPDKAKSAAPSPFGAAANVLSMNDNQTAKQKQAMDKQYYDMIFWEKDNSALPATAVKKHSSSDMWFISRVSIPDAKINDSGNYSCSVGKLFTAIVQVQVLTGELPAAIQYNSAPTFCLPWTLCLNLCIILQILRTIFSSIFINMPITTN